MPVKVFKSLSLSLSLSVRELLGKEEYWPILLSTTCIPALLQLLSLPWFPESPRYLLIDRGDDVACTKGSITVHNIVSIKKVFVPMGCCWLYTHYIHFVLLLKVVIKLRVFVLCCPNYIDFCGIS